MIGRVSGGLSPARLLADLVLRTVGAQVHRIDASLHGQRCRLYVPKDHLGSLREGAEVPALIEPSSPLAFVFDGRGRAHVCRKVRR